MKWIHKGTWIVHKSWDHCHPYLLKKERKKKENSKNASYVYGSSLELEMNPNTWSTDIQDHMLYACAQKVCIKLTLEFLDLSRNLRRLRVTMVKSWL